MSIIDESLTPEETAAKIVAELCPDISAERQAKLREAIESAVYDWGYSMSNGVCASFEIGYH